MKFVKTLGLLAVVGAALMAFAGSASATLITAPTGTAYTGEIHATSEGTAVLKNPIANIECHSTTRGTSLTHGSGQTAKGAITNLLWGKSGNLNGTCHGDWHVTTDTPGTLEIHWIAPGEGTLTSSGAKVRTTIFGINCIYTTTNTHIGTLTDSHRTASGGVDGTATLHVKASIPIDPESSIFCGSGNASWEGSYKIETPHTIYIDQ